MGASRVFVAYSPATGEFSDPLPRNCFRVGDAAGLHPYRDLELRECPGVTTMVVTRNDSRGNPVLVSHPGGDLAGEYALKWTWVKQSLARRPRIGVHTVQADCADSMPSEFAAKFEPILDWFLEKWL